LRIARQIHPQVPTSYLLRAGEMSAITRPTELCRRQSSSEAEGRADIDAVIKLEVSSEKVVRNSLSFKSSWDRMPEPGPYSNIHQTFMAVEKRDAAVDSESTPQA
jgi:hypothetical protein